jgi:hypothetical protein
MTATQETQEKQLVDVNGYKWNELVNEFGLSEFVLHRFKLSPEMLTEEGEKRYYKDSKQGFEGYVYFDRTFAVQKLSREFMSLGAYDNDTIDSVIEDVKAHVDKIHKDEQERKLAEIKEKAKELGYTPNQLAKLLNKS